MQELIEDIQDTNPEYYEKNYNWLHNLLEKEKHVIMDAYVAGYSNWDSESEEEQYYNETFE